MAYRKSRSKVSITDVLPIWTTPYSDTVNLVVASIFLNHGITDLRSYFQKLRNPIVFCTVVCALFGASGYGLTGFLLGGLSGLAAPAVLLWLGVLLMGAVMFMAIYLITWAVVLWLIWWFVKGLFTVW